MMWRYADKLRITSFAQSILVFWRNITALPPGLEEAAFIFHVSRGNWSAPFSAPILQYFATIDNLSVGQAYGAYALPNGMSVVKWEASNNETRAIVLCSTCINHQECTSRNSKTTLMATPSVGCSTSVAFHGEKEVSGLFTTTSVIFRFYVMHLLWQNTRIDVSFSDFCKAANQTGIINV